MDPGKVVRFKVVENIFKYVAYFTNSVSIFGDGLMVFVDPVQKCQKWFAEIWSRIWHKRSYSERSHTRSSAPCRRQDSAALPGGTRILLTKRWTNPNRRCFYCTFCWVWFINDYCFLQIFVSVVSMDDNSPFTPRVVKSNVCLQLEQSTEQLF